ncbi:MAG: alpha/beta fold hydrolase [Marivibrio sp.]|uniref:alpha/beta fold hydrolase n=1 Tax=Marivibrio sp. TaxID=2039719 RepID=UPI0032EF87F8
MTERREPPARMGPRPLAVHLTTAIGVSMSSIAASAALRSGSIPWAADLRPEAAAIEAALQALERPPARKAAAEKAAPKKRRRRNEPPPNGRPDESPDPDAVRRAFAGAVQRVEQRRLAAMLDGIERYRSHPYRRTLADPPAVWREGGARLLDFRALRRGSAKGAVLLTPSLVNRGYVLDLSERCSFARWLAQDGFDVFLMDWGAPGAEERSFALADVVARLGRAAAAAAEAAGRPVGLLGYCMGGLLALPLAAGWLGPHPPIDRLVLLAAPWDFHAERAAQARALGATAQLWAPAIAGLGVLPVDAIQALFAALDPDLAPRKFAAFARMAPESARAHAFVALEDWLNDGVPLPAAVAEECLIGWYGENRPARGGWRLGGFPVDPGAVGVPSLALAPAGDRIVPPASARALAAAVPGCRLIEPEAGHIGMIVGASAPDRVWRPIADFLAERGDGA